VKDSYFERDNVRILESQDNGYIYSLIILKLCLKSAKYEGCLMMTDRIPYTPEKVDILAKIINHDVAHVREAIKMATELDIVSIVGTDEIWMTDIQDMIGSSSTEGDRKRKYRKKLADKDNGTFVHQLNGTSDHMGQTSTRDRERVKSIELKKEKDIEIKKEKTISRNSPYSPSSSTYKPKYENVPQQEQPTKLSQLITAGINHWNSKENLPVCRYTVITLPNNKLADITNMFDVHRDGEILTAIDNLSKAYDSIDQTYRPKNFQNFICTSLDNWFEERVVEVKRNYRTMEERQFWTLVIPYHSDDQGFVEEKKQACIKSLEDIGEEFIDYE